MNPEVRLSMESTMVSFGISQIRESKYYQTRIQWKGHVSSVKGCVTQLNIFVSECLLARAHQHIIAVNNAAYDWLFIFPVVIIILLDWFFLCVWSLWTPILIVKFTRKRVWPFTQYCKKPCVGTILLKLWISIFISANKLFKMKRNDK